MTEKTPDQAFRHDLRGLLSPAMLAADQLSLNPDPQIRKLSGQILDSLDRALALLKAGLGNEKRQD
ncbi:hypothetical protein LOC54_03390 [Acetobacter sp. AN02]|uniref:hypothetical protein n=1 Tax=Acetobacter sp. AN02 TaxID=2894186 RepID=UPI0024342732|nr:hypothetical protein [Acetobacter sp. AN02]MDG6094167.1 hypothetical protein [Acetobacter sp. AN02]